MQVRSGSKSLSVAFDLEEVHSDKLTFFSHSTLEGSHPLNERTMKLLQIILLVGLIPLLGGCKNESPGNDLNELAVVQEDALKDAFNMTEEGLVIDQEALDRSQNAAAQAAVKMGGKRGQALMILAELHAESNKISKEIEQRGNQFLQMLDWDTLESEGDYETRRKFMTEYAQYNRKVIEFFEREQRNLSKRFDEINFQGRERAEIERSFNLSLEQVFGVRQSEITFVEIGIRLINLLEREQGKWSVSSATGPLEFENDEAVEAFNKAIDDLEAEGARQVELQQQFFNSQR